jgi:hypothetical protein
MSASLGPLSPLARSTCGACSTIVATVLGEMALPLRSEYDAYVSRPCLEELLDLVGCGDSLERKIGEEPSGVAAAQIEESGKNIATSVKAREPASGNVDSGKYSRIANIATMKSA